MWQKLKNLFSARLKKTAEQNGGKNLDKDTVGLDKETLHQSAMTDSELAEDIDSDEQTRYKNTSDYCMIRPDANFDTSPSDTTNSQSS